MRAFQILSGLDTIYNIDYPPSYQSILNVISLFSFNIALLDLNVSCVMPFNFYSRMIATTAIQVGLLAVLTSWALVLHWQAHAAGAADATRKTERRDALISAVFLIIFLIYPGTSSMLFATFICDNLGETFEGSDRYLRADLSIDCNASDRSLYVSYAAIMCILIPFGVPMCASPPLICVPCAACPFIRMPHACAGCMSTCCW